MKRFFTVLFLLSFFFILAVEASARVSLTWDDNSADEEGFRVYRAESMFAPFVLIGTVPADTTSYVDEDGRVGHCYRVSAFNVSGESQPTNNGCLLPVVPVVPTFKSLQKE